MCNLSQGIKEAGIAIGEERGIEQGRIQQLLELVRDNVISVEEAVSRTGLGKEEILRRIKAI